jgi:hypothetical protein
MVSILDVQLSRHIAEFAASILQDWEERMIGQPNKRKQFPLCMLAVEASCNERHAVRVMSTRSTVARLNEKLLPLS